MPKPDPKSINDLYYHSENNEPFFVYEDKLASDWNWALGEGSRFFSEGNSVQKVLVKIAERLNELGIPYAVIGGMALFRHGLRRFTEDVDILVTSAGLREIHDKLEGAGYRPPFKNSKNLRDTEYGIRIKFLETGDFPGDGKPKPVAFPSPQIASSSFHGIQFIELPSLIEMKLASGMTNPGRIKDLSDILELIKLLNLPRDFTHQLNPYVCDKYIELWQQGRVRYVRLWYDAILKSSEDISSVISTLCAVNEELNNMFGDGVTFEESDGDYLKLITDDPEIAQRYDMHREDEMWLDDMRDKK